MILKGKKILITRPEPFASELAKQLLSFEAQAILFPLVEIESGKDTDKLPAYLSALSDYHWAIFNSPTAVLEVVKKLNMAWPSGLSVAAIGEGTASRLRNAGISLAAVPKQFNSEALLALPHFQKIVGKKILLFRGEGGRALLAPALQARGAQVTDLQVYRRVAPCDKNSASKVHEWQQIGIDAIVVSSQEILNNLIKLVGHLADNWLKKQTLLVTSLPIYQAAISAGFQRVWLAKNASHEVIVETLKEELWKQIK